MRFEQAQPLQFRGQDVAAADFLALMQVDPSLFDTEPIVFVLGEVFLEGFGVGGHGPPSL
jgi:hypothetical protein